MKNAVILAVSAILIVIVDALLRMYCVVSTSELISLVALEITLGTFWWINLSPYNVKLCSPRSIHLCGGDGLKAIVCIPLTFYNGGAITAIIKNMRVRVKEYDNKELLFTAVFPDMRIRNEDRTWAAQFPIEVRKSVHFTGQFIGRPGIEIKEGKLTFTVEIQYEDKELWVEMNRFVFRVEKKHLPQINTNLLPYDLSDIPNN